MITSQNDINNAFPKIIIFNINSDSFPNKFIIILLMYGEIECNLTSFWILHLHAQLLQCDAH